MSDSKKKSKGRGTQIIRLAGDGVSILGGVGVAQYLQIPHGLPSSSFVYGCAPIAAVAGYEFGRWVVEPSDKLRAWVGALLALFLVPLAYFLYYWQLNTIDPGVLSSALLYLLFATTFFLLFCAFGVLQVQIFNK